MKTPNSFWYPIALGLTGLAAICATPPAVEYKFTLIDAPAELGAFLSPYGINNAGVLVGNFLTVNGELDGFVFDKGDFTDVAVPGVTTDDRGALSDVNDLGQAVGGFSDEMGILHSFIRDKHGNFTLLPDVTGAVLTEAASINNLGDIVGSPGPMTTSAGDLWQRRRGDVSRLLRVCGAGVMSVPAWLSSVATFLSIRRWTPSSYEHVLTADVVVRLGFNGMRWSGRRG
jgi:hypothetical protein